MAICRRNAAVDDDLALILSTRDGKLTTLAMIGKINYTNICSDIKWEYLINHACIKGVNTRIYTCLGHNTVG